MKSLFPDAGVDHPISKIFLPNTKTFCRKNIFFSLIQAITNFFSCLNIPGTLN